MHMAISHQKYILQVRSETSELVYTVTVAPAAPSKDQKGVRMMCHILDALVTLVLMIKTYSLTLPYCVSSHHWDWYITQSLIMEPHSKWNVVHNSMIMAQNEMSLIMECCSKNVTQCYSKLNVTKNGISPKMECHAQMKCHSNEMSLKIECRSKYYFTQNWMSLKIECH